MTLLDYCEIQEYTFDNTLNFCIILLTIRLFFIHFSFSTNDNYTFVERLILCSFKILTKSVGHNCFEPNACKA